MKRTKPNLTPMAASKDPVISNIRANILEIYDFLSEVAKEQGGAAVSQLKTASISWPAINVTEADLSNIVVGYLKADGSVALTNDWNVGNYQIVAATFKGQLVGTASGNLTPTSALNPVNIVQDSTHRFTNDTAISRLANTSGTNTGDQTLAGLGGVPTTRQINGKALSSDVTLTTADIADSTDRRYCTDAQKIVIGNTSGTNTGDNYVLSAHATGTVYSLTITPGLVTFGTTSPSLTLDKAGTYLIRARAQVVRNNSTHIAGHTITLKLRRTNNTAADLTNASTAYPDDPHNAANDTEGNWLIPEVIYTTANSNDVIELWGSVSSAGTGGTHDVSEASIVAVRLY